MKKLPLLSSAALAALLFVGCSSDNTDDVTPAGEVKTYTELGAGLPSTRTTLEGASVVWSASDEISVWSDVTTTPVTFSLDSGAGTSNATFTVPEGSGVKGTASSIYKAVYPANANGNISIPQAQRLCQLQQQCKPDGGRRYRSLEHAVQECLRYHCSAG